MKLPPRLYKYQPFDENSTKNLKEHQIWFSKPTLLNDPFDCAIRVQLNMSSDEELAPLIPLVKDIVRIDEFDTLYLQSGKLNARIKQVLAASHLIAAERLESFAAQKGVACFSENKDDLLMWSHYARGHTGFCLEFDTRCLPFSYARKVDYTDEIPFVSMASELRRDEDFIKALFLTKAICWAYEEEWRILSPIGDTPCQYPPESLTSVYFGVVTDSTKISEIMNILKSQEVKFYQGSKDKKEFRLVWTQIPEFT